MPKRTPPTPQQHWEANRRFARELESKEEFKLLSKLAKDDETTAVEGAVQQVIDLSMAKHAAAFHGNNNTQSGGGAGLVDYHVSRALMELAQSLEPARQGKMVEFVSKLQKQLAVADPSSMGEPLKVQGDTLWTDLPSFGYTELETWYEFGGARVEPNNPAMEPEQKQRFANLNAFIAQLTQAADNVDYASTTSASDQGQLNIHPMDKSLHAIWTMQYALEDEGTRAPANLVHTAAMRAACLWFIYAADRLWGNVQNGCTYPASAGAGFSRLGRRFEDCDVPEGCRGYAIGRWRLWERGLAEAEAVCTRDEDERMRTLIQDALVHMQRVQSG